MHIRTPWAVPTFSLSQDEALMAPTHWMTAHPAPAKAAQTIIAPPVDPLAATQTTLLWERTHPPKPGIGKGTGEESLSKDLLIINICSF